MDIIVKQSTSGQFVWEFKSKGRITANNETFPTRGNAVRAAKAVVTAIAKHLAITNLVFASEKLADGTTLVSFYRTGGRKKGA